MLAHQLAEGWFPTTPADQALVHQQLEKLLSTPHFSSSRRYPSFLRFVVNNALSGQTDLLKERILGIEIFGRDADYDTATGPIVRVTAAEIRKRIEQYYQEAGHDAEIRISLRSGSYVPQFFHPGKTDGQVAEQTNHPTAHAITDAQEVVTVEHPHVHAGKGFLSLRTVLLAIIVIGLAALSVLAWRALHPPVIKTFWAPFIAGEFLVDAVRMDEISRVAPKGWDRKNIEVILETQVIQGRSGPPRIAAAYVW